MTSPRQNDAELRRLLDQLVDSRLSDEDTARLREMLLKDEGALDTYVAYLDHCAALEWNHRPLSLGEAIATQPADSGGIGARWPLDNLPNVLWQGFFAVVCVAVGTLFGFALRGHHVADDPVPRTIATLTRTWDTTWLASDLPTSPGSRLGSGTIRLKEGVAEIQFDNGATVMIEGPTTFEPRSQDEGFLRSGKVYAQAEGTAVGFTITTTAGRIVDLGTRFGVTSDNQNNFTEVHVLEGAVDLFGLQQADVDDESHRLRSGAAGRVDASNPTAVQAATFLPKWFARLSQETIEPIEWDGNGHFYRLVVPRENTSWTRAAEVARESSYRRLAGHLVTITSREENDFVVANLLSDVDIPGAWIGLSDSENEGDFRWVTGEPNTYGNWTLNEQPSGVGMLGQDEDFVHYWLHGPRGWTWNDEDDIAWVGHLAYIIEYE